MIVLSPVHNKGDTVYVYFNTYDSAGASATISGFTASDIEIYKNGSMNQRASDNGYTLLDSDGIDLDGAVGVHGFSIDTSDNSDSGFWADGNIYHITLDSFTADGQTVRITFQLALGFLLRPATAGRTLVVDSAGLADATAVKLGPSGSATAQTARDVGASVNVGHINSVATTSVTTVNANIGTTQPVNFTGTSSSALVKSDMVDLAGSSTPVTNMNQVFNTDWAVSYNTSINRWNVNVTAWDGGAVQTPSTAGVPKVDIRYVVGNIATVTSNKLDVATVNVPTVNVGAFNPGVITSTAFDAGAITSTVAPNLDAAVSTRATNAGVWDLSVTGHATAGTFGEVVQSTAVNVSDTLQSAIEAVAGDVWEEATGDHQTSGTFGEFVTSLPGLTFQASAFVQVPGSYGELIANINENVNLVGGDVDTILTGLNLSAFSVANVSGDVLGTVAGQVAPLTKIQAAVYDSAPVTGNVITLSTGATQTIDETGRTTVDPP